MTFAGVIDRIISLLNPVAVILIGLALMFVVWGLAISVLKSGNEEAVQKGRQLAIWGSIGLFVIVAVWGLVYLVVNSVFSSSDIKGDPDVLDPVIRDIDFS